jgi:hypothetical protein
MTPRSPRHAGPPAALALTAVLTGALLAGCGPDRPAAGGPALRLVGFSSCDDLLAGLRRAVRPDVGPYGVTVPGGTADVARGAMPEAATGADAGAAAPGAAAPGARAAVRRRARVLRDEHP